jgi:hypothetical protein
MNNSVNSESNQVIETAEERKKDFFWNLICLSNVINAMKGSRKKYLREHKADVHSY